MASVIFFDIDGTLITEDADRFIPESARRAIELTRQKGNLTFINSGRTEFNISRTIRELGFDGFICGCGTYIEYRGEVLLHNKLSQNFCREVAEINSKCGVIPVYEHRNGYFFDDKAPKSPMLEDFLVNFVEEGIPIDGRVEDDEFVFDKFVIWDTEGADMDRFRREIGRYFEIIDRGGGFYENVPLGFSKATAIDRIMKKLDIPLENAYAIGDSMNDLPMLKAVPNSIAMGGAEVIYPYVSFITTPLLEKGIYNALDHFGLL